jgi:WD40 repeat protein
MELLNSKSIVQPVILLQLLDDSTLLVVDSQTTIRYFKHDSLELFGGFKVGIHHKRYKSNVVACSQDGEYLASLSADCRESRLYNTHTKQIVAKVDRHHGEASCVGIDPLSRYLFSC